MGLGSSSVAVAVVSSNVMQSIVIVNMIQESCIHSFPIDLFGELLDILPKNFIFLKTFNSEFSYTKVWFITINC